MVNCLIESVTSSEYYDPVGKFKLTPEDISLLSQELKNALIPFNQVKITGDLGEGIHEPLWFTHTTIKVLHVRSSSLVGPTVHYVTVCHVRL